MSLPRATAIAAGLLMAGCTTLDSQLPATQARQWAAPSLGAAPADGQTDSVPAELDINAALRLSVQRSPQLAATLAEAGLNAAEIRQATRLTNPVFGIGQRQGDGSHITNLSLEWELLDALLAPARSRLAATDYQRLAHDTAHRLIGHGQDVRDAWLQAAAAQQQQARTDALFSAFEAAAQLGARQRAAGNLSAQEQARLQVEYAEFLSDRARQRLAIVETRERLNTLIGLWGEDAMHWRAASLPPLPDQRPSLEHAEALALNQRQDIASARVALNLAADRLKLTERTRWLNLVGIGIEQEREKHGDTTTGPHLSLSLPLFDTGGNQLERDRQAYAAAFQTLRQRAIEVRAEVRTRYAEWQLNYDIARHQQDTVVPLRQQITAESLKHYNGMLTGVYHLLEDARQQLIAEQAAEQALVNFWHSQTALESALGKPLDFSPGQATHTRPAITQEHLHGQP